MESSWNRKESKQKLHKRIVYCFLILVSFLFLRYVGSAEPFLFDDSQGYMKIAYIEGVMPAYPLFLLVNQFLFGMEAYESMVVLEQSALTVVCIIVFVRGMDKQFQLANWEIILITALALFPFTTNLPESMTTQEILTEGIAYPVFYLWMLALLKTVWMRSYGWLATTTLLTLFLALTRSQLQILFGVCGLVLCYVCVCKMKDRFSRKIAVCVGIIGCAILSLAGIWITSRSSVMYGNLVRENTGFKQFAASVQNPETQKNTAETADNADKVQKQDATKPKKQQITTSQYISLIFSRGMYEAEETDAELFEDGIVKELYRYLYDAVDQKEETYAYAQKGLWMWKDITGGVGLVGKTCYTAQKEFYRTYYPEIMEGDNYSEVRNHHLMVIGTTLLKAHIGRFIYHTMMLLPQAFICTVFFQIAPIYLLCHLVTLFLYLSAIIMTIWAMIDRKANSRLAEFMAVVLVTDIVMVCVISTVFFGQQRYLVYAFGIFYIAYYLLLKELWVFYLAKWAGKLIGMKENKVGKE